MRAASEGRTIEEKVSSGRMELKQEAALFSHAHKKSTQGKALVFEVAVHHHKLARVAPRCDIHVLPKEANF